LSLSEKNSIFNDIWINIRIDEKNKQTDGQRKTNLHLHHQMIFFCLKLWVILLVKLRVVPHKLKAKFSSNQIDVMANLFRCQGQMWRLILKKNMLLTNSVDKWSKLLLWNMIKCIQKDMLIFELFSIRTSHSLKTYFCFK
jgi:hypothetical protein